MASYQTSWRGFAGGECRGAIKKGKCRLQTTLRTKLHKQKCDGNFPRQHPVELMKLIGKLRNHLRAANGWNSCTFPFNRAADDDRRHSKTMKWELNESVLELKLENDAKARTLFPPV